MVRPSLTGYIEHKYGQVANYDRPEISIDDQDSILELLCQYACPFCPFQ